MEISRGRLGELIRQVLEENQSGLMLFGKGTLQAGDGSRYGKLVGPNDKSYPFRLTPARCKNESELKAQITAELERIRQEIQEAEGTT